MKHKHERELSRVLDVAPPQAYERGADGKRSWWRRATNRYPISTPAKLNSTQRSRKPLVHRMIAQGMPTQPAEDRLRQLQKTLAGMKGQHRPTRPFEVRQTVRHHRSR